MLHFNDGGARRKFWKESQEVLRSYFVGVAWYFSFHSLEVPILKQRINWHLTSFNSNNGDCFEYLQLAKLVIK